MVLRVAVLVGAVVGLVGGGPGQLLAIVLGLPVLIALGDLGALLVAIAVGIHVHIIDVGLGRAVREIRRGPYTLKVRILPLGFTWFGRARGHRLVRTRFFVALLASLFILGVLSWGALFRSPLQGLGAAGLTLIVGGFLPLSDGQGRLPAGRLLLTLPRMDGPEIGDWSRSRLGGAALDAAFSYRYEKALSLAERALAVDPNDRTALRALQLAAAETGETLSAIEASERLLEQGGDNIALIGWQLSLAWALVQAREAGQAPADWHSRARAALDEADQLGARFWQLDDTRALLSALLGRWVDAEEQLAAPLREAVHPDDRASVLLTLAYVRNGLGDRAGANEALGEARRLWPSSPRIVHVERRLGQDELEV